MILIRTKGNSFKAHIAVLMAMVLLGLLTPSTEDAMNVDVSSLQMAGFRIIGTVALLCFITPIIGLKKVAPRDLWKLAITRILSITLLQSMVTLGINHTSPLNVSVEILSQPIFVLILAVFVISQRITWRKCIVIFLGSLAALLLVPVTHRSSSTGNLLGDLFVLGSQLSFAFYLTLFVKFIRHYDSIIVNRILLSFVSFSFLSFMLAGPTTVAWNDITLTIWVKTTYVIVFCIFIAILVVMFTLKHLLPTVLSIYNYVHPLCISHCLCFHGGELIRIERSDYLCPYYYGDGSVLSVFIMFVRLVLTGIKKGLGSEKIEFDDNGEEKRISEYLKRLEEELKQ